MKTKTCSKCGEQKDIEDFAWKLKSKGKRQSRCKSCYREYCRNYYNSVGHKKQIKRVQQNTKLVYDKYKKWKSEKSCIICGENAVECLELHHKDPSKKDFIPAVAVTYGWKRFLQEAEKCIMLCSNCHRKVHSGRIMVP